VRGSIRSSLDASAARGTHAAELVDCISDRKLVEERIVRQRKRNAIDVKLEAWLQVRRISRSRGLDNVRIQLAAPRHIGTRQSRVAPVARNGAGKEVTVLFAIVCVGEVERDSILVR